MTFTRALKRAFPDSAIRELDYSCRYIGGDWVTPCMCGHDSHGYSGHCEHMCCDTDGCDCGGYEPQPGCARPAIRVEGPSPFLRMISGRP